MNLTLDDFNIIEELPINGTIIIQKNIPDKIKKHLIPVVFNLIEKIYDVKHNMGQNYSYDKRTHVYIRWNGFSKISWISNVEYHHGSDIINEYTDFLAIKNDSTYKSLMYSTSFNL